MASSTRSTLVCQYGSHALFVWALSASSVVGQWTTVITVPPDSAPNAVESNTQLNVFEGGILPISFHAGATDGSSTNVQINFLGGVAGNGFAANPGSTVNVTAGSIGASFSAASGSVVTISGGTVGDAFRTSGDVTISGGSLGDDFRANRGSHVTISGGTIGDDFVANGAHVTMSDGSIGDGFRTVKRSIVTISGGSIGDDFSANDSVTISGGTIGDNFRAATVTVTEGHLGNDFRSRTLHVSGGSIGDNPSASAATITGGSIGDNLDAAASLITGGKFGDGFDSRRTTIVGQDFRLNGEVVGGLETAGSTIALDVSETTFVSGVLSDGRPFVFAAEDGDFASFPRLTLEKRNGFSFAFPGRIVASVGGMPEGLRGQTLIVDDGSRVPDSFNANPGSRVVVERGGALGNNFEAIGTEVEVIGGLIGDRFDAFPGSTVRILSGAVGDRFEAFNESTVVISGGEVGADFTAFGGSKVHLIGQEFFLDSVRVAELVDFGDSIVLDRRGAELTARLTDDSNLDFDLSSDRAVPGDYFDSGATLQLTVAFPAGYCDLDNDSSCQISDINTLLAAVGSDDSHFDLDYSGSVDVHDIAVWLANAGDANLGRPYLAGDANLDGAINESDLNAVGLNWNAAGVLTWSDGDFTGDSLVDARDLNTLGLNWPSPAVPVAEPNASALSSLGWLVLLCVARLKTKHRGTSLLL